MSFTEIVIIVCQFFLSLSILIILHEAGHFIPAKLFKTRVEKFYLFFDVKFSVFKKKIGETVYGIGWLPLGGYVKISGMIDESMDKEQMALPPQPWEFRSKPAWQRLIIMLGGVFVNFVLAWIIYVGIAFTWGDKFLPANQIGDGLEVTEFLTETIGLKTGDEIISLDGESVESYRQIRSNLLLADEVEVKRNNEILTLPIKEDFLSDLIEEEPESLLGIRFPFIIAEVPEDSHNVLNIKKGDVIVSVNGQSIKYSDQFIDYLDSSENGVVPVTIIRKGKEITANIEIKDQKLGVIHGGASIEDLEKLGYYKLSTLKYSFTESFPAGTKDFIETFKSFGKQLKKLANPKSGAYKGLGSFVSIAKIFPTTWDWQIFWTITAFLSIMLGVLNLLPIPALDGGHAMFLTYEIIFRRKPSDKFLEYAQMVGFFLLIALFVFAFGNDIYRHFIK
ncbi:MAG: RIP metalloprotease RseP [Flavobacteriaceae bacterium]|nr:RIP metalloprotease RseP [Flavobacteriaceae bacterium]